MASSTVRLLPASQTRALDMQLQRITEWRIATPAVHLTFGIDGHAALLPVQLLSVLQQQLFASVAYSTTMEQLEGSRPVLAARDSSADVDSSWGPVFQVTRQHSVVQGALCEACAPDVLAAAQTAA
jgi:hypothetical protein